MPNPNDVPLDADRWRVLSLKKALGKSTTVQYVFTHGVNIPSLLSNLELRGDDGSASHVCLTLTPPRVLLGVPIGSIPDGSDVSGTVTNDHAQGFQFADPFVEIEWGVGGNSCIAQCDISNGLVVNLCASYLRVRVGVGDPLYTPTNGYYQLSCFVGPGTAKAPNAQRTIPFVTEGQPLGVIKSVPAFAKNVIALAGDVNGAAVNTRVSFFRDSNASNPAAVYDFNTSLGAVIPLPVPNGAYYYITRTPTGSGKGVTIFELAI